MAFLNLASLVVLGSHFRVGWATRLLLSGESLSSIVLVGLALLTGHLLYFRRGSQSIARDVSPRAPTRIAWIAPIYILTSVVVFMYVSALVPAIHHN
ncbi:MAG TPA: hypothetical protein VMT29_15070 [Steroidobacteraceae bacterium]|nr:hypothetical protein [Steroidobacteraceae bacterium]